MKNWIQDIIPLIKDKRQPLKQRLEACFPHFIEAARTHSHRNLASELFDSIYELKYAKPFMVALAAHMKAKLSAADVDRILYKVPELHYEDFNDELTTLKEFVNSRGDAFERRNAFFEKLASIAESKPNDVAVIFMLSTRYQSLAFDWVDVVQQIRATMPEDTANTILEIYQIENPSRKSMRP